MLSQMRRLPLSAPHALSAKRARWCVRGLLAAGVALTCVAVMKVAQLTALGSPSLSGAMLPRNLQAYDPSPPSLGLFPPASGAIKSYCAMGPLRVQNVATSTSELASIPRHIVAHVLEEELAVQPWESRVQPFVNVFLVWLSHRDTWTAIQDRVLASLLTIRKARIRIVSNSLPQGMFAHLSGQGYDIAVMRYNLTAWMRDAPGGVWASRLLNHPEAPHAETQLSDFIRLLVLYKFGGLYLDTDALWIGDVAGMPANFIGKIDYLKLEPTCDFCLDKRWYLANGVLSFRARHPFIRHLLTKIDEHPFDPMSRTDIGPKFVTVEYQAAPSVLIRGISILDEPVLYPIPGPDVPKYMAAADDASDVARRILANSRSVHVFAYTFNQLPIAPESTYGILLTELRGPLKESLCVCEVQSSLGSATLCTPHSVVLRYRPLPHAWFWPYARVCVNVRGEKIAPGGLRASPIKLTITAEHGILRHWRTLPARSLEIQIDSLGAVHDALASLEYRHAGGYCNDVIQVSAAWRSEVAVVRFPVSAPCMDAPKLLAVPKDLQRTNPASWAELLGAEVPSVTRAQLDADPARESDFSRCARFGHHDLITSKSPACTKVALLVSATGSYVAWLDELIASAEQYFMTGYEVHYFILTDRHELAMEPRDRIHLIYQRQLGWPMDSMYRHQLYLKHRAAFKDMDFIMVLDADAAFNAPVGPEILGASMGTIQSFFFGQPASVAPFETDQKSSSFVGQTGSCYYAGGLFGGTLQGFTALLQRSTWLMEWDLVMLHRTAPHDDESYLNKMFHVYPPEVSLGGNYIMPEPPADRAWGLKGVNWKDAFPPKIYNLGARKWLGGTAGVDRDYRAAADPLGVLTKVDGIVGLPAVDIAVCAPLQGSSAARAEWAKRLVASIDRWYSTSAKIIIMDTSARGTKGDVPSIDDARIRYMRPEGAAGTQQCSPAALAKVLQESRAPHVLLLGHQAVLTWQSSVQFLSLAVHELQQHDVVSSQRTVPVVGLCPRSNSSARAANHATLNARFEAPEGCSLVTLEDGTLQPSYGCGSCDVWQEETLTATPALRFDTAMRALTCFSLDGASHLASFDSVVTETDFMRDAVREFVRSGAADRLPPQCGVGCIAAAALRHAEAEGRQIGGIHLDAPAKPVPYRCIADMQPFLAEPGAPT